MARDKSVTSVLIVDVNSYLNLYVSAWNFLVKLSYIFFISFLEIFF
jgi:hypothetical protein